MRHIAHNESDMTAQPPIPFLSHSDLMQLARPAPAADSACERCRVIVCPGWESLGASVDRSALRRVGSLRDPAIDEPTVEERHPAGTHAWSADAPIALAFFPYNRCEVWQCLGCTRPFLRYTEYGGYYEDERIRALDAALIDPTPVGA
jgi:hypothetical protein